MNLVTLTASSHLPVVSTGGAHHRVSFVWTKATALMAMRELAASQADDLCELVPEGAAIARLGDPHLEQGRPQPTGTPGPPNSYHVRGHRQQCGP